MSFTTFYVRGMFGRALVRFWNGWIRFYLRSEVPARAIQVSRSMLIDSNRLLSRRLWESSLSMQLELAEAIPEAMLCPICDMCIVPGENLTFSCDVTGVHKELHSPALMDYLRAQEQAHGQMPLVPLQIQIKQWIKTRNHQQLKHLRHRAS